MNVTMGFSVRLLLYTIKLKTVTIMIKLIFIFSTLFAHSSATLINENLGNPISECEYSNLEASLLGCVPFLSSIPPHNEIAMKLNIDTYSLTDCKEWCKPITDYLKYNSSQRYFFQNEISNRTKKYFDLDDSIHQYLSVYSSIIRR